MAFIMILPEIVGMVVRHWDVLAQENGTIRMKIVPGVGSIWTILIPTFRLKRPPLLEGWDHLL